MTASSNQRDTGRAFDALRPCEITLDPMGFALSSVIVNTGKTSVLCSVSLQEGVPSWREGSGKGWLSAEYRLLPGSTLKRQSRELLKLSGRTQEIQRLIGRSLRAAIDLEILGERTLLVDCDVIQADAGTRTASITGAWIALHKAFERLIEKGLLDKNPLIDQVAAVSVGIVNGRALVDLNYIEDSNADVDLNIVMAVDGRLLELQGTAERSPFSRYELDKLLDMSEPALKKIHNAQNSFLNKQG